jgi:hypothetical protein
MDFLRKIKDHFIPNERNVYRPHILRRSWLVFFVAVVLTAEGVFLLNIMARQSATDFIAAVLPGEVIALTNTERTQNSVGSLRENTLLDAAAQAKANDMAAKGYFAHVGPDGTEPWVWIKSAGYDYQYAGENLAVQFTDSTDVVNAWMASPTHRANIVKPQYTEIGIGVAQGTFKGEPATYVVQYFGAPRAVAAEVPATKAGSTIPTPPSSEQVAGAETSASGEIAVEEHSAAKEEASVASEPPTHQAPSPRGSFARNLLETGDQPNAVVLWLLGGVASLLILALAFTFFIHIQIQPTDMLVSSAVVVAVTLAFIALNVQTVNFSQNEQTAAVFGAMPTHGGFVDTTAASFSAQ